MAGPVSEAEAAAVARDREEGPRGGMVDISDGGFVDDLFQVVLGRRARPEERAHWVENLRDGMPDREVFRRFARSKEYRARTRVIPGHPPGHFYSPVVDPEEIRGSWKVDRDLDPRALAGVRISMAQMQKLWRKLEPFLAAASFPEFADERCRFYVQNGNYPIGDAAILRAMIGVLKPRRIVEIGCGFSTACMLDALDDMGYDDTRLTCIDPYPDRLLKLLRPRDFDRVEVIEKPVQAVDLGMFEALGANDLLFIDSSHVMKTGSDVNFELFDILPRLEKGVNIHFHDIHYPFEYSEEWVFNKKHSWNEIYGLRAFLMYNYEFEITFFTNLFARKNRELIQSVNPEILRNPGASLWIRKDARPPRRARTVGSAE